MESYICRYSVYENVGQDDPVRSTCNNNICKLISYTSSQYYCTYMNAIKIRNCLIEVTDDIPYINIIYQ